MLASALGINASHVTCVENSVPLRSMLAARGFKTASSPPASAGSFTAVALLNVLDRCDEPKALLSAAVRSVKIGGLLLIATVLPFGAKVYEGKMWSTWGRSRWRRPLSPLDLRPIRGSPLPPFEASAAVFLDTMLRRHPGMELEGWTRLP